MPPTTPSDDEAWIGERADRWLRQADGLERQLSPVSALLFEAAALTPGERVLDVGCGTGPTTRQAADLVGPSGAVTGLDIAEGLLAAAAAHPAETDAAPIEWHVADAVEWTPTPDAFDVVLSRFGVMFFSDPVRGFANLAAATRTGGRLAAAVWSYRDMSPLFEVPLSAAMAVRRAHGLEDPDDLLRDGGPFSLGDIDSTTATLREAGWSSVEARVHDVDLVLGGGQDPVTAAAASTDFGATRLALADVDQLVLEEALAAIADRYHDHLDDEGRVVLAGRVIIITARRG